MMRARPERNVPLIVLKGDERSQLELETTMKRIARAAAIGMTAVALTAGAAVAAPPWAGSNSHGKAVSEVAKAAETAAGRAHGAAVSEVASAWGKQRSAEARAKAAENRAAGQAKGSDASEPGRLKSEEARSR